MKKTLLILLTLILSGCVINIEETRQSDQIQKEIIEPETFDQSDLNSTANFVLSALRNKNMMSLSKTIDEDWLLFSPYAYINTWSNIVLSADQILSGDINQQEYLRWIEGGSGEPLIMNFDKYLDSFVYDVDFLKLAEKHINQNLSRANSISNSALVFSWKTIIEYYVPWIDPIYEWLDRRSLSLVFDLDNWLWKLIAIIHNQRTP